VTNNVTCVIVSVMECRAVLFAGIVCNCSYAINISSKNVFLAYPQGDVFVFLECLINMSVSMSVSNEHSHLGRGPFLIG
jgi:hypothetical protein